ncbi:MotA/TolQ/ExbB proton channel family protein [bacterium]|nr:MotA/TolQ/ExbB proton channel family protein [bacterium]
MNVWTILQDASLVNKAILVVLFLLSLLSWVVVIERWRFFRRAKAGDRTFFQALRGNLDAEGIHKLALNQPHSPSGRVYLAAEREVMRLGRSDANAWGETLDLERDAIRGDGEKGLPLLAVISSSAPFIGLLGTVWGVMIAFLKLGGIEGQPALEVVGPGIAEALIATAMGLFAAIPAVMAYNGFTAAQRNLLRRVDEFNRRLVVSIRSEDEFGR